MAQRKLIAAITGAGVVTGLGSNLETLMDCLYSGKTAVGPIRRFSLDLTGEYLGAELGEADPVTAATRWAVQASKAALAQAGWSKSHLPARVAVIFGTTAGEAEGTKVAFTHLGRQPEDTLALRELIVYRPDTIAHALCEDLGLRGYRVTLSNACATGLFAIDQAVQVLATDQADVVLVCTVDLLSEFTEAALKAIHAIALDQLRPFDAERSGTLLGDGAGALVLESPDIDPERVLGYIPGVAIGCDAFDLAAHQPDGLGMAQTMRLALQKANLSPADIVYLNAHGTGTRKNDEAELLAIEHVFGDSNPGVVVNSTKPAIGHTGAASGILEALIALMAIKNHSAPPTLFHTQRDPLGSTGVISAQPVFIPTGCAMSNSFGFGGSNGSIVISACLPQSPSSVLPPPRRVVISGSGISALDDSADILPGLLDSACVPLRGFRSKRRFYGIDDFAATALAAASRAITVSGLTEKDCEPDSLGIVLGTCYGSAATNREIYQALSSGEGGTVTPFMAINSGFNVAGDVLAIEFGARAFAQTIASGELSSLQAIALAAERVRYGRARAVLGLGCDLLITPWIEATRTIRQSVGNSGSIFHGAICHLLETPEAALARTTSHVLEVCASEFDQLYDGITPDACLEFYARLCNASGLKPTELHLVISFAATHSEKLRPYQIALDRLANSAHAHWLQLDKEVDECGGLPGSLAIARAQYLAAEMPQVNNILVCITDIWGGLGVMLLHSYEGG